jgi:malonyl-CoA O-methyltransferase
MRAMGRLGRLLRFGGERLPARDAYAVWAATYPPRPHNALMETEQSVLAPTLDAIARSLSQSDHLRTRRALDLGTGTGRYLPHVAPSGMRLTVGLDLSMPMLERQAGDHPRTCGDACSLPFADGSFDLVCSSLMAGDVERLDRLLGEVARVLAPGGHFVYSDFHPSWATERWRRTFRASDGRLIELSYFAHSIDEHLALLERASFSVRTIREPRIAGRRSPVVVVFHAVKARRTC